MSTRGLKGSIVVGCVLLVAAVGAWLMWRPSGDSVAAEGPPPAVVAAVRAEQQSWQDRLDAVGALGAVQGVQVTTEVGGLVSEILFESGQRVEKGERLVQLSTDADRARLASLRAQAEQARSDLRRQRTLARRGLVAQAELEQSATALKSIEARASEQRALIDKKRIEAPFAGQLGIRQVDLGEYLPPGSPVVVLESVTPIHVNFSLPEQHYGKVSPGQQLDVRVQAYPQRTFRGVVTAVSPRVADGTRNFAVQGQLANESGDLRSGMSAHVTVTLEASDSVTTLPATAISYSPYGSSIYVVQAKGVAPTVARKFVELAERRGSQIAVEGVEPGTLVVTAGQMKLFDGAPVMIADERQARSSAASAQR